MERDDHPWFVGVQFHPELKSRPFAPHPLFASFIGRRRGAITAGVSRAEPLRLDAVGRARSRPKVLQVTTRPPAGGSPRAVRDDGVSPGPARNGGRSLLWFLAAHVIAAALLIAWLSLRPREAPGAANTVTLSRGNPAGDAAALFRASPCRGGRIAA